jgi:hypothetical protein
VSSYQNGATIFLFEVQKPFKLSLATVKMRLGTTQITVVIIIIVIAITSRDSSVGIALSYGLDDRGSRVRFSAGAGNFSLHHHVQNGSGAHPASYPMGTRGSFPGDKAACV